MEKAEVLKIMKSSKSPEEWNINLQSVREAHGGDVPDCWWEDVMLSGLFNEMCIQTSQVPDPLIEKVEKPEIYKQWGTWWMCGPAWGIVQCPSWKDALTTCARYYREIQERKRETR